MANEGERYGCDKRQQGPSVTVTMAPAKFTDGRMCELRVGIDSEAADAARRRLCGVSAACRCA